MNKHEYVHNCLIARATILLDRLLIWIRKKRGPKINLCGTSEIFLKIQHCSNLSLWRIHLKEVSFTVTFIYYKHFTYKINQKISTQATDVIMY